MFGHRLHVRRIQAEFLGDLLIGEVQPHQVETQHPHPQRLVVASQHRVRQIVETPSAGFAETLLLGFGVVTSCVFSTCYQERHWRLYLPMLTSRQPCCRNFNWLAAKGRTLRVASLRDE